MGRLTRAGQATSSSSCLASHGYNGVRATLE